MNMTMKMTIKIVVNLDYAEVKMMKKIVFPVVLQVMATNSFQDQVVNKLYVV